MKGMNTEQIDRILGVIIRRLYFILVHSWKSLQCFNHEMTRSNWLFEIIILDTMWRMEYGSRCGCRETSQEADAIIQEKDGGGLAQSGSIGNRSFGVTYWRYQ